MHIRHSANEVSSAPEVEDLRLEASACRGLLESKMLGACNPVIVRHAEMSAESFQSSSFRQRRLIDPKGP